MGVPTEAEAAMTRLAEDELLSVARAEAEALRDEMQSWRREAEAREAEAEALRHERDEARRDTLTVMNAAIDKSRVCAEAARVDLDFARAEAQLANEHLREATADRDRLVAELAKMTGWRDKADRQRDVAVGERDRFAADVARLRETLTDAAEQLRKPKHPHARAESALAMLDAALTPAVSTGERRDYSPQMTPEQMARVRAFRAVMVPAPPEAEVEDPDHFADPPAAAKRCPFHSRAQGYQCDQPAGHGGDWCSNAGDGFASGYVPAEAKPTFGERFAAWDKGKPLPNAPYQFGAAETKCATCGVPVVSCSCGGYAP